MNRDSVDWHGPMPAAVTPFRRDGSIDARAFVENLEGMVDAGATGFIIGGCTGEFWAMTGDERVEIFRLAADAVGGRVTLIAGTSAIRIADVIELTRAAEAAGCDGAMILPPWFVRLSDDEVFRHYAAVAEAVSLPIMLYNIPQFGNNAITPTAVRRVSA